MKKLTLTFGILMIIASTILAQAPQSFKYQAVARDNPGNIIAEQDVGLRISILAGGAAGTPVYVETHLPHTNLFGLFSINIGQGTVVSGNFSGISWGTNTYFIQTEMDPAGGTLYALMGTSQLLSVPYALYSENTENVDDADADPSNEFQKISKIGSTVTLSNGGGSVNDDVDDADNDPSNEFQTLAVIGNDLKISSGNIVTIPGDGGAKEINDLTDGKTGGSSVFLGSEAGENDDGTNNRNVGIGWAALNINTSGFNNTAIGFRSLQKNTSGSRNIAIGNFASGECLTGDFNVSLGDGADGYNKYGSNNTVVGYDAGGWSVPHSKSGSVFLGYRAGFYEQNDNKLYIENSFSTTPLIYGEFDNDLVRINGDLEVTGEWKGLEINDLADGKTDTTSIFLGEGAGFNHNGINNQSVAVGDSTLYNNTMGFWNTAVGYKALYSNTYGYQNIAMGNHTLFFNTSGNRNTGIGNYALYQNTSGDYNIAIGATALEDNTTGNRNHAFGYRALWENITGSDNIANGYKALHQNTSGNKNVANGYSALYSNTSGDYNTANGSHSLWYNNSGYNNTANGSFALHHNTIGEGNTANGYQCLEYNNIGIHNTANGAYANFYNQQGSYNTVIGYEAGKGTSTHNKSGCVLIGYQAGSNNQTSNKLYIDNSSTTAPLIYGEFDNNILRVNGNLGVGVTPQYKLHVAVGNETAAYAYSTDHGGAAFHGVSTEGKGVYGEHTHPNWTAPAVLGKNSGSGAGVLGSTYSSPGEGVYGVAYTGSGINYAVRGKTWSAAGYAGYFEGGRNYFQGNVGIGTTNPGEMLHVDGKIKIGSYETLEDGGSSIIQTNSHFLPTIDNSRDLGSSNFRWDDVYATNGTIITSDRREKENIQTSKYGLDEILKMNPVTFTWKDKPYQGEKIGLIAQDLQKLIPEVVKTEDWQFNEEGQLEKIQMERLGVYYSDLIPVLVKGMQEQQEEIDDLKQLVSELKTKLDEMEE